MLQDNPSDPRGLLLATHIFDKAKRLTTAYQFARRLPDVAPQVCEGWVNLARMADQLYLFDECNRAYGKALELARTPQQRLLVLQNQGAACITQGKWKEAERISSQALEIDPQARKANGNLGMARLALGRWADGWKGYDYILGSEHRKLIQYGKEPVWTGQKDQVVAVYGEQGLGDEICFASMVPDLIRDSRKVIIDCDPRLKGLFARSFRAKVYGTRNDTPDKFTPWEETDQRIDASISMAALGAIYRRRASDFPGIPYLTADAERALMWRSLWTSLKKPAIGVAWSGGVQWTGAQFRRIELEQLLPLFRSLDATWVSLQYKDAGKEIEAFRAAHPDIDLRQYRWATLSKDYDDTAGLVASLDAVVAPPTAVVHLAGALGVPCVALRASIDCWKFAAGLPFHQQGVTLVPHAGSWPATIDSTIPILRKCLA